MQVDGKHFNFVFLQLGGVCINKVSWFDIAAGPESEIVIETNQCSTMPKTDTSLI